MLLTWGVPATLCADGTKHYLAFASDRHGNMSADDPETPVVSTAMSCWSELPVEYVSLIGDMVGAKGGDAPAYDVSEVWQEVKGVFPSLAADRFSIVWADHDGGWVDDLKLGVMKVPSSSKTDYGNKSTQIYTDPEHNYYIYAVNYYEMLNYTTEAPTDFKRWVDGIDPSALVIVLCHAPMHYKRKDNKNGANWSDALNYAATGSATGTDIKRNVVFLHGHNHTTEAVEYYYAPGSTVEMQGAKGAEQKTIQYTYITAGYLKKPNGVSTVNATLLSLDDDEISFTKSRSGQTDVLGKVERVKHDGPVAIKCATPVLKFANGRISCTCDTPDVTFVYSANVSGAAEGECTDGNIDLQPAVSVSVLAVHQGYEDSDTATLSIDYSQVGDVNHDGTVTIADVTTLVNLILGKVQD